MRPRDHATHTLGEFSSAVFVRVRGPLCANCGQISVDPVVQGQYLLCVCPIIGEQLHLLRMLRKIFHSFLCTEALCYENIASIWHIVQR